MEEKSERAAEFSKISFVPKKFPQIKAASSASLLLFALGACVVWSSSAVPELERTKELGELTQSESSWIASIVTLGALVSGPFVGYAIEKFGRKTTIILLAFPLALGWLLISFAQNVMMMCVGRFLTGFSMGGSTLAVPVYISEISEESLRGIMYSISCIFLGLGILFVYIAGAFVSWFTLSIANVAIPVALVITMYFVPETPLYLISKGQKKKAGKALQWFRGAPHIADIEDELNNMQIGQEGPVEITDAGYKTSPQQSKLTLKTFFSAPILKPFGITMVLMVLQQLSGINAVLFYTLTIFESAGTNIDPKIQSIVIGVVVLFAVTVNSIIIDRLGRRLCLIISETGISICLITLGVFFYLKEQNDNVTPSGISWLPLVCLMSFVILYNIGIGPMAWLLMSELLPTNVKGLGSAIATSFNWILAFIVTKSFESLTQALGTHGSFWLFGAISASGMLFSILYVPETKGRTLDDIQREYFAA